MKIKEMAVTSILMDKFVHQQNLENFRKQLAEAKDEAQRMVLTKLLADEKAKDLPPRSGK
jgi:hypothetical protein